MKLAILQTDILHPEFLAQYHGYGVMFQRMFAEAGIAVHSDIFSVIEGIYPDAPEQYDAMLITGSKADAFSDEPWIIQLKQYLQQRFAQGQKLLGICFGHQLLAHSLGGVVQRAAQGWGVGIMDYHWCELPTWAAIEQPRVSLICSHRDQVVTLPAEAKLLAKNDFCPNAAFYIDSRVLAFQPHPEFTKPYAEALLRKRWQDIGEDKAATALVSYQAEHQGQQIAQLMASFIRAK
ncbi:glutamine amidotransferase [Shewanella avicenniae]|uniref:Glutamine amidotransferase n=1 Tax=Shewanella avicenniae TaxID=2814294 RepID=A0ABX7QRY2_9GAMM|nr:glutamine amidotransferase [Shewanella avicenniae]QSX34229.1 glutamine amidotransferase [Shewanella avicenniae]